MLDFALCSLLRIARQGQDCLFGASHEEEQHRAGAESGLWARGGGARTTRGRRARGGRGRV
eukprot:2410959-Rhodomonas_salina.1